MSERYCVRKQAEKDLQRDGFATRMFVSWSFVSKKKQSVYVQRTDGP